MTREEVIAARAAAILAGKEVVHYFELENVDDSYSGNNNRTHARRCLWCGERHSLNDLASVGEIYTWYGEDYLTWEHARCDGQKTTRSRYPQTRGYRP